MATDYDCWRDCENVNAADVIATFKQNVNKITDVLLEAVKMIGSTDWEQDIRELKVTLLNVTYKFITVFIDIFLY